MHCKPFKNVQGDKGLTPCIHKYVTTTTTTTITSLLLEKIFLAHYAFGDKGLQLFMRVDDFPWSYPQVAAETESAGLKEAYSVRYFSSSAVYIV